MMRAPALVPSRPRRRESKLVGTPAPVAGWNARDALASMGKADAVILRNWFPKPTYCEIRGGHEEHMTGFSSLPKSLMPWNGPASQKMFVSTNTNIYECTSAGTVGASVGTCTNGKWIWTNYAAVSGNHYLIMVNGVDAPRYYDGTTWTVVNTVDPPNLSGLVPSTLCYVNLHKHRLFFLQTNKLNFWYLPVQSVSGALTEFVIGSLAPRGGYTMAMATWTIDAGAGADDYAVFVTSEGEVLVFRGTDPDDANAWAHEGTYYIGKPLGRKCFTKYGGDLIVLTEGGAFPLSKALLGGSIDTSQALTDKIAKPFNESARLYGSTFGWEATLYPAQSALILNIPISEGGRHIQYVMNTTSRAWCEFSDWDAEAFLVFGGQLYFVGGDNAVYKAWSSQSDLGSNIVAEGRTAFHYLGPNQQRVVGFRPLLLVNGSLSYSIGVDVDFEMSPLQVVTYTVPEVSLWDDAVWDVDYWGGDLLVVKDWRTPASKMGFRISGAIKIATNTLTVQWAATDFLVQSGEF